LVAVEKVLSCQFSVDAKEKSEKPWNDWAPGMSRTVKIQIFGQTYPIQAELDQEYVQKLAAYVDEKMRAISDMTPTVDTQKVAILAALAIADELHSLRNERGDREELLKEQAERCLTLVERALKQAD
jgi:cell division protein ZapA